VPIYERSFLCSFRKQMWGFHDLLRQRPSSLCVWLRWSFIWFPEDVVHVSGFVSGHSFYEVGYDVPSWCCASPQLTPRCLMSERVSEIYCNDVIASNHRMTDEQWTGNKVPWRNLRHYTTISTGTEENHEILSQDSWCSGWDLNRESSEYNSGSLPLS
jgi:hypothetical protein